MKGGGSTLSRGCACRFRERMDKFAAAAPAEALRVMEEELAKLAGLEQASSEFNVTRNYLDWLTQLPWGQQSVERLDVDHAQTARAPRAGLACRVV